MNLQEHFICQNESFLINLFIQQTCVKAVVFVQSLTSGQYVKPSHLHPTL